MTNDFNKLKNAVDFMDNVEPCGSCNQMIDYNKTPRMIMAYYNGKPVYSKDCPDCTRKNWRDMRAGRENK